MVAVTTIPTLRADFITTIKAITPTHTERSSIGWNYVQDPDSIEAGAGLRVFSITFGAPTTEIDELGTWNDGWSAVVAMRVWVSYQEVHTTLVEDLIEQDQADLFYALEARINTLSGLLSVMDAEGSGVPPDFVVENDEETMVGYYDFSIRYYRRDS